MTAQRLLIAAGLAAACLCAPVPTPAFAEPDPALVEQGKKLYRTRTCAACHGVKADKGVLDYPALAGMSAEYLLQQMNDIKAGLRVGGIDPGNQAPRTKGMQDVMHLVSDDDMAALAVFIASLPPAKPQPLPETWRLEPGQALYTELGCSTCHGETGTEPIDPSYPTLAGQKRAYLFNQMIDMREGTRTNAQVELMADFVKEATVEQLEAIADYLSQVSR